MSRIVWLNGALVEPDTATVSIDDPAVRHGVGLFETMRCEAGRVSWLDRHLARMSRSAGELGFGATFDLDQIRSAVLMVAAALDAGPGRVRLTVTPGPTTLIEGAPLDDPAPELWTAITVRGAWHPGRRVAEHKSLSYLECAQAQQAAVAAGADIALMLDRDGRLGEASIANVMCVIGGRVVTAPIDGLLPGVARQVVMELTDVEERVLDEREWRQADEVFATNALRGVVPVTVIDGTPVGSGTPGPATRELADLVSATFRPE